MKSTRTISWAVVSLAALVLAACSSGSGQNPRAPSAPPRAPSAPLASTSYDAAGLVATDGSGAPAPAVYGDQGAPVPIDLATALRLAGGQNLDLRGLREYVRQAQYEMINAGQWFFPSVHVGTGYRRTDGLDQLNNGDFIHVNKQSSFVGGDVVLNWEIGEGIFNHLAAKQRSGAARADARAGVNDTMVVAAEAYFDLLRAQASLDVAQASVDLYDNYTTEQEAAINAGRGFRGDLLSARARRAHSRVRRDETQGQVHIAAASLREILNLPASVQLRASEPQPVPLSLVDVNRPEQVLIQEALAGRPEIQSARMNSEAVRAEHNATTKGVLYPDVRVGWRAGGLGRNYAELDGRSEVGVGLGWTLGRGGIGDSSRQSAMASRSRRARLQAQRVRQAVVRDVTTAQAAAIAQQHAIGSAEQGVKDAEEALRLYRERSTIGVNKPLEAIVFEGVLTQARLDYVDAIVAYNKAQIHLLRALGRRP